MTLLMCEFTGEEVLTQCFSLGPYLFALGIGSFFGDRVHEDKRLSRLIQIEWLSVVVLPLLPLVQLLSVFLFVNTSPVGLTLESKSSLTILLALTGSLSFCSGLLGGLQLPLILKAQTRFSPEAILSANYMGPLFAGISVILLTGWAVDFSLQIYFVGIVQLAGIFFLIPKAQKRVFAFASLAVPLFILYASASQFPELEHRTVKSSYLNTRVSSWREFFAPGNLFRVIDRFGQLERSRTPYQTIDLYREPGEPSLGVPGNVTLYLNRKPQFDLFSVDTYHQSMVYGALNLLQKMPDSVLILGAGDGLLLKELRRFSGIKKVKMVELDAQMISWSATNDVMTRLNQNVLSDVPENASVVIGDAVTFLRKTQERFDLILVDFPFPNGPELAKLYSREFYRLVNRALTPEGLVIVDLPLYLDRGVLSRESQTILLTMAAAGFHQRLPFGPSASFIALKPRGAELRFQYDRFPAEISLATAFNLVAPFPVPAPNPRLRTNTMFWPGEL